MINIYNQDCLEALRIIEEDAFDLAIVDPPYGIGAKRLQSGGKRLQDRAFAKFDADWDDTPPTEEYFYELMRVSKNQIIWGGNYFFLPPSRCWVIWDKCQPWENFSQVEMAWTSFDSPSKIFKKDSKFSGKIHPTQKPVELYDYLFGKFAQKGFKILDTHLGSGSSAIAASNSPLELEFTGYEISKDYYEKALKRLSEDKQQIQIFKNKSQLSLFSYRPEQD